MADSETRALRLGVGITTSTMYMQREGRRAFLDVLLRMAPRTHTALLATHTLQAFAQAQSNQERWIEFCLSDDALDQDRLGAIQRAQARPDIEPWSVPFRELDDEIRSWQLAYGLSDDWIYWAAYATVQKACKLGTTDVPFSLGYYDHQIGPHTDLLLRLVEERGPIFTNEIPTWGIPLHLDMLEDSTLPGENSGGFFGSFDPRLEGIEDAFTRLLPELSSRLHQALVSIEEWHREETKSVESATYLSVTAFDWLVCYQVRNETYGVIADAYRKDKAHVSREVRLAAERIGLTLRESDKGGRPRRTNAHTVTVKPLR